MLIVKDNIKDFTKWLANVQKKKVPYALSLALTSTAQKIHSNIIDAVSQIFNLARKRIASSMVVVRPRGLSAGTLKMTR
jgi:hypothetical protein